MRESTKTASDWSKSIGHQTWFHKGFEQTPNHASFLLFLAQKAVADMDKFPGPHSSGGGSAGGSGGSIIGKTSPLNGCYPISPLHVKRRSSSNPNSNSFSGGLGGAGLGEEKMEAKGGGGMGMGMGMGMGSDNLDAGYLPQLRRSEG